MRKGGVRRGSGEMIFSPTGIKVKRMEYSITSKHETCQLVEDISAKKDGPER